MHLYTLKKISLIAHSTILLTIIPKSAQDKFEFYPGQYAAIGFKYHNRPSPMRCFSIVSSPNNSEELQFAMRIYGDFTTSLSELQEGDIVFVRGPFGEFMLDEDEDHNVILLAGGIGITPFMSMIRYATEEKLGLPITLLYSNRSQENIPFYDELIALEQLNPRLKVAFCITDGGVDQLAEGHTVPGLINETRLSQLTAQQYNRFTYFICGPKAFIKTIKTILSYNNTDPIRILTEEFTPASQVNKISLLPKSNISRWTYGLTGATLLLATGFIMAIDLVHSIPKLVNTESAKISTTSQASSSSDNSSSSATNNLSPSSQAQPYQSPVTSVS